MIRSILGAVTAAVLVVMAGSAWAQGSDPANSPFAAVGKQYIDAYNRKDAAAIAVLFTDDAVRVTDRGIIRGRADIQKSVEAGLNAGGHDLKLTYHVANIDGNTGWTVAEFDYRVRGKDGALSPMRGFATSVWANSGGAWKIKGQSLVIAPPPK